MGTHLLFFKNSNKKNQENYFTKMERKKVFQGKSPRKKCLKVKPLNKKIKRIILQNQFKKN